MILVRCFKTESISGAHFEGLRELRVATPAAGGTIKEVLAHASFRCRRGDPAHTGLDCLACPHLVNFTRTPDEVRVRCLFADDDVVRTIMTLAAVAVTVSPTTPPAHALTLAAAHQVNHLLVVDDQELVGVVRCADLATAGSLTAAADRAPWAVAPNASLGEVTALVQDTGATLVLVVDGREVVGLITRHDLERFGVPPELLAPRECASD